MQIQQGELPPLTNLFGDREQAIRNGMVIEGKRFEVLIHMMHRATVRRRKSIHDAHACICARLYGFMAFIIAC